ncbi:MAG: MFS transporter [Cypionkella sp.]
MFGGFVALALWLPHYLIDVYSVDVKTAGMSAAAFSLSASVFRAYGGHLSDRYGARRVMYWTFGFSAILLFMLAYPPTELHDFVAQWPDPVLDRYETWCRSIATLVCAWLLHEPGQGSGLQAYPGLLSQTCGRGRRSWSA